jgi:hypothetical protein
MGANEIPNNKPNESHAKFTIDDETENIEYVSTSSCQWRN